NIISPDPELRPRLRAPVPGSEPQPRLSVYATHPPGELRSSSPALSVNLACWSSAARLPCVCACCLGVQEVPLLVLSFRGHGAMLRLGEVSSVLCSYEILRACVCWC
ncbi:uncharacterized protein BDR25DRAFT_3687, partial [Lindgomyces ingoldianus]